MEKYSDFHIRAMKKVRRLWQLYIINSDPEELEKDNDSLPENLLMIGTGRHEFYKNQDEFLTAMTADQLEAREIIFELQDEWYDVQTISEDICVVYGSIWAREKATPGKAVLVDMEGSRFTAVCKDKHDDVEICSIHHSMPYVDQGEDEFYPKSLASLANEAVQKSKVLERRVEMDHMTELYNRSYMEWHVSKAIKKEAGYFIVMDLDGFKSVNDSMGHLAGDKVIQEFARLLRSVSHPSAILGRMGGDEFAVWDSSIQTKEKAQKWFTALAKGCGRLSADLGISVSCSAGIAVSYRTGEDFAALYQRADEALYHAKALGKGCFAWAEDKPVEYH